MFSFLQFCFSFFIDFVRFQISFKFSFFIIIFFDILFYFYFHYFSLFLNMLTFFPFLFDSFIFQLVFLNRFHQLLYSRHSGVYSRNLIQFIVLSFLKVKFFPNLLVKTFTVLYVNSAIPMQHSYPLHNYEIFLVFFNYLKIFFSYI